MFIPLYYLMRTLAHSFVMQGDYSYSLTDLPFNIPGNVFGYLLITLFGTDTLPLYQSLRSYAASHLLITIDKPPDMMRRKTTEYMQHPNDCFDPYRSDSSVYSIHRLILFTLRDPSEKVVPLWGN